MSRLSTIDGLDIEVEGDKQQEIIEKIIQLAKNKGATQVEASISKVAGVSVQSRKKEVETIEFNRDCGLSLTVYSGKSRGSISTSDLEPESLETCVNAAMDIARFTAEDEYAGLADPELLAKDVIDLGLDFPADVDVSYCIEQAVACESYGLDVDPRIVNSVGASFSTHRSIRTYANSNGFMASNKGTKHWLVCQLIGKEGDAMHQDSWYTSSRDIKQLEDPETVGKKAAKVTLSHLSPKRVNTMKVPVILHADISSGFFDHLFGAISGGNLYRKTSFMLDAVGQKVLPDCVSIVEDPRLQGGLASSCYDEDGIATRKRTIVQQGYLESYVLGCYSARRLGLSPTGNAGGLRNVRVSHGDKSFDDLVKSMDRGIVITDVMGQGVDIVTGNYSRGGEGFWVEQGQIQYPITEFTIAGNLKEMYQKIVEIGCDIDLRSATHCGSILMDDIMIAGSDN